MKLIRHSRSFAVVSASTRQSRKAFLGLPLTCPGTYTPLHHHDLKLQGKLVLLGWNLYYFTPWITSCAAKYTGGLIQTQGFFVWDQRQQSLWTSRHGCEWLIHLLSFKFILLKVLRFVFSLTSVSFAPDYPVWMRTYPEPRPQWVPSGSNMRFGIILHTLLSLLMHAVTAGWQPWRKARSLETKVIW